MKPHTLRRIDLWIGRPVCLLLTVLRRVGGLAYWLPGAARRAQSRAAEPVRKILFIKMIEQGATVLAYRALARAVERVGRENVYFWVFQANREILDLLQVIPRENVLTIRAQNWRHFVADVFRTLWRIRRLKIDATVDMEFFARAPAILGFLTGARRRVGLHRFTGEGPYRGDLLTHRVQHNPYLHVAVSYFLLVEALDGNPAERPMLKRRPPAGGAFDGTPPAFVPSPDEVRRVRAILRRLAGRDVGRHIGREAGVDAGRGAGLERAGPFVLLNPNASDLMPLRKWPAARFVELGRRILARHPRAALAITGAPGEREAAAEIAREISGDEPGRCISLAGETSLRELVTAYTLADVLVTNDSGPGHFASMTAVETVVLFGPETPALFGPLGPRSHVLWAAPACSPCVNVLNHRFSPCTDNVCMREIQVQDVYDLVARLLRAKANGPARNALPLPVLNRPAEEAA